VRVHYFRQYKSFHRRAPPFLPVVYDTPYTQKTDTHNDRQTDRSTNLIISSNVHFVPLAEINI